MSVTDSTARRAEERLFVHLLEQPSLNAKDNDKLVGLMRLLQREPKRLEEVLARPMRTGKVRIQEDGDSFDILQEFDVEEPLDAWIMAGMIGMVRH
jgi:hypothetical protein